jgi:hypothetical protein
MNMKNLAASVAILSMVATNVMANECQKNFQATEVTGTVSTSSLGETMQSGTIDLQLTSIKKGKVLFDDHGAIVGRITVPTDEFGLTILDHNMIFDGGSTIETSGDIAQIVGLPDEFLNFPVEEIISNFWGTKTFKRATGTINASGTVNPYTGLNDFILSGTVCIRDFKGD